MAQRERPTSNLRRLSTHQKAKIDLASHKQAHSTSKGLPATHPKSQLLTAYDSEEPNITELRQKRNHFYSMTTEDRKQLQDSAARSHNMTKTRQAARDRPKRPATATATTTSSAPTALSATSLQRPHDRSSPGSSRVIEAEAQDENGYVYVYGTDKSSGSATKSHQSPDDRKESKRAHAIEHRRSEKTSSRSLYRETTTSMTRRSMDEHDLSSYKSRRSNSVAESPRQPKARSAAGLPTSDPHSKSSSRPNLHRSSTTSVGASQRIKQSFIGDSNHSSPTNASTDPRPPRQVEQPPGLLAWIFQKKKFAAPAKPPRPLLRDDCIVCNEECVYHEGGVPSRRSTGVELGCGCVWCNDCVRDLFHRSLHDRTLMPPRCCPVDGEISRKKVWRLFWPEDERFLRRWIRRYEEWKTDKGLVCPVKGCGTYIAEKRIEAQLAISTKRPIECHRCKTNICLKCHNIAHGSRNCPEPEFDADEYAFEALAVGNSWQQCPHCKIRTSKEEGCNHMTCACGAEFCFLCGKHWHEDGCRCPYYTADQMPPPMTPDQVRMLAQELDERDMEAFLDHFRRQALFLHD